MIKKLLILLLIFSVQCIHSQEIDPDLLNIKSRMDSILGFTADLKLEIVIDFINMPTKHAQVNYIKGKPIEFSSDDFMLIPKRGLDFAAFTVHQKREGDNIRLPTENDQTDQT